MSVSLFGEVPDPDPARQADVDELMKSDCIRIFDLCNGAKLRAMMKSARGEPIVCTTSKAKGWFGLPPRRSDRFAITSNRNRSACGNEKIIVLQSLTWRRDSNGFPDFHTAQTMRASRLAKAIAALLLPQRPWIWSAQARRRSGLDLA